MNFSKFFSNLQEAPWYRDFLNPVIDEAGNSGKLLDIGTGSGKLIQILSVEKNIECIGVDTNNEMLKEAKVKLNNESIQLVKIETNQKLPFENNSFDCITICSVLFHLKNEDIDLMLKDAQGLLKENGKIVILTPTGKGNILNLSKSYFSIKNLGIYVWYSATKNRAKIWTATKYLEEYASKNKLKYKSKIVMSDFAQLEILS
ncbi:MAG: methyltransferase domain-containing protein [Flavobacteriaceae bacterium]